MTAQGKITATGIVTELAAGRRVRILLERTEVGTLAVTSKKTSAETLEVTEYRVAQGRTMGSRRRYVFLTSAGVTMDFSPSQTFLLAPEDAAGIKRAHVEALAEDAKWEEVDRRQEAEAPTTDDAVTALVLADRQAQTDARVMEALEAGQPEDGLEVPTKESTLAAIGGCWTGGTYTGHALAAWADGDYASAMTYVNSQKALQATADPEALLPDHQERMAQAETLGQVAQEVLDMVDPAPAPVWVATLAGMVTIPWLMDRPRPEHFRELAPGVAVAPIGDPAPTAEDLSDLTAALAAEDLENIGEGDPFPTPADPKAVTMDVVTIHRGDRLYEVIQLDDMSSVDGLARVAPCDPEDHRDPFWVSLDLLHVRPPVAIVETHPITERVRQTQALFTVAGQEGVYVIRTVLTDSRRLPEASLAQLPGVEGSVALAGHLRSGEALVVDGRTFRVLDLEGTGDLTLEPARWRSRLGVTTS